MAARPLIALFVGAAADDTSGASAELRAARDQIAVECEAHLTLAPRGLSSRCRRSSSSSGRRCARRCGRAIADVVHNHAGRVVHSRSSSGATAESIQSGGGVVGGRLLMMELMVGLMVARRSIRLRRDQRVDAEHGAELVAPRGVHQRRQLLL